MPSEFIATCEDTGLIGSLGRWSLSEALQQMRAWQRLPRPLAYLNVNLSPRQLTEGDHRRGRARGAARERRREPPARARESPRPR
jgi:EAL domain-containing protein (putative c-di-GMP-specific phosphodiesterase class I)